jgi:hypothetical protein
MIKDNAEIERIFSQAADLRDAEERAAFLDTACGQAQTPAFISPIQEQLTEQVGNHIGPYKLHEEIGEGGASQTQAATNQPTTRCPGQVPGGVGGVP